MIQSVIVKAVLSYHSNNEMDFNRPMWQTLRFSLWKNNSDFTAAEIIQIHEGNEILPGQTKTVTLKVLNTKLARDLKIDETVYIGVPHTKIGECKLLEVTIPIK